MNKGNIFTHKILPIISIIMLFSFVFINNNVFASSDTIKLTYNDTEYLLPTINTIDFSSYTKYPNNTYSINSNYSIVIKNGNPHLYVLPEEFMSSPMYKTEGGGTYFTTITDSDTSKYMLVFKYNGSSWSMTEYINWNDGVSAILYSTVDVYWANSEEIFFQKTPVAVIPALETAEQIPGAMVTVLKLIIPVSLIVLSSILLIYLVRSRIYQVL